MIPTATINAELLGRRFEFQTSPGLFSAGRVDDGTRLLLSHLPQFTPGAVLDVGCGYGALGLPVAAVYPQASVVLVDRDLLAVQQSRVNALACGLANVETRGSLGYRDVGSALYDWVLCNVPARIGDAAIEYLLGAGAGRLSPGGELRVVVIRDLEAVVRKVAEVRGWPVEHVTSTARHGVFRLGGSVSYATDHESIYLRDTVSLTIGGHLAFERPHDISEEPGHLRDGLPLLLECLPHNPRRALVWRGGYGVVAVALARRGATVLAADKDLLATTYTRRNASRHGVEVSTADILTPTAPDATARYDVIVGELAAPAGLQANQAEICACLARAAPKAQVLWLGLTRTLRDCLPEVPLASRGAYSVVRATPPVP